MIENVVTVLFVVSVAMFLFFVGVAAYFETKRLDNGGQTLNEYVDGAMAWVVFSFFAVLVVGVIRVGVWGPWV